MNENMLRWPDMIGVGLSFGIMIVIGIICARRSKSAEGYFLADRKMPGWVVGISLMATTTSSMTFLATPGYTYEKDWSNLAISATYPLGMMVALFLFMPFFRRIRVNSAYEYLEKRFGLWARLYSAAVFLLFQFFRMGIILYAVSLSVHTMTGFSMTAIMLTLGIIIAFYTILGGLEAVLWTDAVQGIILTVGGLICLPIILMKLPGGMSQILEVGWADNKFSLGSTALSLNKETIWVMLLTSTVFYTQSMCTDQTNIQRYCAAKTDKEARRAILIGAFTALPIWVYFIFLGTALYVFYKVFPAPELSNMKSEQVLPFFILTCIPPGVAGFVLAGFFAAAMSTLDSSINASAATFTNDFYRRLLVKGRSEIHYLWIGRALSLFFAAIMITVAFIIYSARSETLVEIQLTYISLLSGGLLGLFLLGFLSEKVDNVAAIVATVGTILVICVWGFLDSSLGRGLFPNLADFLPNKLWINVLSNTILFTLSYFITTLFRRRSGKNLDNLTIWTVKTQS